MKVQVIEKKKGRIDRTTGEIIKGNLRVCAYARVSTEKEEQLNSYNSQLKYYEEKIKSNSDWLYVGIYADEGITGTLDYKRDGFMKNKLKIILLSYWRVLLWSNLIIKVWKVIEIRFLIIICMN